MPEVAAADRPALARPGSLLELFLAFTSLALQGFGGVIAVAQRELCERRRWLDARDFVGLLGNAQVLPGPNVCNLSLMIGDRFFGWRGALVALAGMVLAPMVLLLMIAALVAHAGQTPLGHHLVQGALSGITAVAAGQIVGTVLKLAAPLKEHVLGALPSTVLALLTLLMIAWLHWPLLWVLLGLGGLACVWSWRVLQRTLAPPP